jgi:hypothetical protein
MTANDIIRRNAECARQLLEARAEIKRLRERLGPLGLEVVMINGAGHYVNKKVKAEIERLRAVIAEHEALFDKLPRLRDALENKP